MQICLLALVYVVTTPLCSAVMMHSIYRPVFAYYCQMAKICCGQAEHVKWTAEGTSRSEELEGSEKSLIRSDHKHTDGSLCEYINVRLTCS